MQRTLTLVPFGGIGNRISAIESAIRLSRKKGYNLKVVWFKDWGMKACFLDLFQPIIEKETAVNVEIIDNPTTFQKIALERPRKHNLYSSAPFQGMLFDKCFYGDRRYVEKEELLEANRVYIASCYEFFKGQTEYSIFRPSKKIQKRVNELTKYFADNTIGLHVRRGDHVESASKSPLSLFEALMDKEAETTKFYLSTDSQEVKDELIAKYPGRILTDPKTLQRGSYEAECEAMAEMFTLSRCCKVIGSFNSSFGLRAAEIGRIPFKCVVEE